MISSIAPFFAQEPNKYKGLQKAVATTSLVDAALAEKI